MARVAETPGYVNIVTSTLTDMFRWNFNWDVQWIPDQSGAPGPGIIPCGQFCVYYAGVMRPDGVFQSTGSGTLRLTPTAWRFRGNGETETMSFPAVTIPITDRGWDTPSDDLQTSWFWVAKIVPPLCRDFIANWTVDFTGEFTPDVIWFGEYVVMGSNVSIQGRQAAQVSHGLLTVSPEVNDGDTFESAHPVYVQVNLFPW